MCVLCFWLESGEYQVEVEAVLEIDVVETFVRLRRERSY